jgi:hypothetical protein
MAVLAPSHEGLCLWKDKFKLSKKMLSKSALAAVLDAVMHTATVDAARFHPLQRHMSNKSFFSSQLVQRSEMTQHQQTDPDLGARRLKHHQSGGRTFALKKSEKVATLLAAPSLCAQRC